MNKIYIVAGERNMRLAQSEGGLWANVGQTTRNVYERLRDDDYKRKAAGGKWMVLFEQDVGDMTTDKQIHPLLKNHPDISWDAESYNTEEFFFKGDLGDGVIARQIVSEVLQQVCLPVLQQENARLKNEINDAQEEIEKKEKIIKQLASGEMVQRAMERLLETEKECQEIKDENEHLQQERAASIQERQAAHRISEENRRYKDWLHEEKRGHEQAKAELDKLRAEANRRRQPQSESTPMWLWAIPLALLSYCGGCTRAENKWEDTLSKEQLAEKHHYLASWREDATPEKVENELIGQWKYASDLVEQNSRLKAQIKELTAERDKVKSGHREPSTIDSRAESKKTASPKDKGITFPYTCQSLDRQVTDSGDAYTNCEGSGRVIRVWGDWLYGSVTLEKVGTHVVATDRNGRKVVSIR